MNLTRCENGHYYNKEKFPSCPHCAHVPTFLVHQGEQAEIETALPNAGAVQQINHTLRKTTGWLVCTKGNMIGESFPVREGKNRIGRSTAMDIILLYENSVSREDHACIIYDAANRSFTLAPANEQNNIAVNDRKLAGSVILHDRDVITLGRCTLVFIAFCNETFGWNN